MSDAVKKARDDAYGAVQYARNMGAFHQVVRVGPALDALCAAHDADIARLTAALEEAQKSHEALRAYRDACDELEAAQAEAERCLTKKRSAWDIAKSELTAAEKKHADALAALRGK